MAQISLSWCIQSNNDADILLNQKMFKLKWNHQFCSHDLRFWQNWQYVSTLINHNFLNNGWICANYSLFQSSLSALLLTLVIHLCFQIHFPIDVYNCKIHSVTCKTVKNVKFVRFSFSTLQELQWFLPKMMKTIISDCIITMQVYANFRFPVVQSLLLDLVNLGN